MEFGLIAYDSKQKHLEKGMSMKLYSVNAILCVSLVLAACNSKKDKTAEHTEHSEHAVVTEETDACSSQGESMGIHGDLTAYTKSAQGLFHVKIDWSSPLTSSSATNVATLNFVDEHAHELPVKLVSFKLFMPAMGHGTTKADQMVMTQDAIQPNIWTVDKVNFSMGGAAGEWVVDVEGSRCGQTDKARVIIPVEVQ